MRDDQTAFIQLRLVEHEDIEVQCSRSVFFVTPTPPPSPMLRFDGVQAGEQIMRRERGRYLHNRVDERRLILDADGRGFVQ